MKTLRIIGLVILLGLAFHACIPMGTAMLATKAVGAATLLFP